MIPHSQCQTTHSNPTARCFCPLWPTKFLVPNHTLRCAQPTTLRERPTYRVTNLTGRGVTARAWWLPKANFGKWKKPCEKEKGSDFYPKSEIPEKYWHAFRIRRVIKIRDGRNSRPADSSAETHANTQSQSHTCFSPPNGRPGLSVRGPRLCIMFSHYLKKVSALV